MNSVVATKGKRLQKRVKWIGSRDYLIYRPMWKNLTMSVAQAKVAAAAIPRTGPLRIVDVGCGRKPYRDLFGDCEYTGINYGSNDATPDVLADAMALPIANGVADIILCTQVIEHVSDPYLLVAECARVLKPGGALILTGPYFWPLHEEPHDYFRFTRYGFQALVKKAGLETPVIRCDGGTWSTVGQAMALALPRVARPLVPLVNLLALLFDRLAYDERSPINYTVLTCKPQ